MSLRDITDSESNEVVRTRRLIRIVFTEDAQIFAVWQVQKGARHVKLTVQVTEAVRADIMGRPGVQAVIDAIRDDTKNKVQT